jgi:hypothetical protein
MSRPLELVRAALFVLPAPSTFHLGLPPWNYTLAVMLVATLTLAVIRLLQPAYHGVLWQKVKPNLDQWWHVHQQHRQ